MSGSNKTDFNRQDFYNTIYDIVREIPAGRVVTYGLIARLAGSPQYSRLVGQALTHVPATCQLPCHRVVNSQGRLAPHWPEQQILLRQEGIRLKTNGCVSLQKYLWEIL